MRMDAVSTTAKSGPERRACYRVDAPAGFLREVALWLRPNMGTSAIVTLDCLGAPDFVASSELHGVRLEDVSTRGLGFSFVPQVLPGGEQLRNRSLYVYIKLHSPAVNRENPRYCLFLGARAVHLAQHGDRLHMGLRITQRGTPERTSKAIRMFDVARFGVRELTRWCDDMTRMGRGMLPPATPGLDMEQLLSEIAAQGASCRASDDKR
ncbi:hypothetical protein [Nitratidesulfovibrio vulgaris]|nr:hypothetical protein [Nitratidesulfovibrio vulgaris]WCB47428.1 hypothetical protein PH214_04920 [Nitratidesulfovibrio vulgaris]GEB79733.1 hypothetical protein DDE01_11480 [Desulfovibrio desulfuricans]HBW15299.1 hypothetical protein [Desulfovibrio sp.]